MMVLLVLLSLQMISSFLSILCHVPMSWPKGWHSAIRYPGVKERGIINPVWVGSGATPLVGKEVTQKEDLCKCWKELLIMWWGKKVSRENKRRGLEGERGDTLSQPLFFLSFFLSTSSDKILAHWFHEKRLDRRDQVGTFDVPGGIPGGHNWSATCYSDKCGHETPGSVRGEREGKRWLTKWHRGEPPVVLESEESVGLWRMWLCPG